MKTYLFIATNEWAWGGSEILWSESAERLARLGVEVRVSFQNIDKPLERMERVAAAGCKIFYRRPFSLTARLARKVLPLPNYHPDHVRSVSRGVDLVVISQSSFDATLPWIEAVRAAKLKYVIIVQGASTCWWPNDTAAERMAAGFENAARTYFVSQATLDLCHRQLASPLQNGRVIRNPFNVNYDTRTRWPDDGSEELNLAFVGRLELATKGLDMLLDILSLAHWRERKIRVSLVGSGPQERVLRRHAEELKLTSVHFAGHQNEIEKVWGEHHVLVLPSRQEGMPLVVVEAMLCGRPCIATDVGGNRELICDGINGFLAKAPTVELLDEAMNRAWENRSRLQEMGERAAHDVRRWVSPDPVGDFVRELTAI